MSPTPFQFPTGDVVVSVYIGPVTFRGEAQFPLEDIQGGLPAAFEAALKQINDRIRESKEVMAA